MFVTTASIWCGSSCLPLNWFTIAGMKKDLIQLLLVEKRYRVLRHLVVWLVTLLLVVAPEEKKEYEGNWGWYGRLLFQTVLMALFYINMYVLIPKTIYKNKYTRYLLYLIGLTGMSFALLYVVAHFELEPHRIAGKEDQKGVLTQFLFIVIFFILLLLPTTALKIFQRWVEDVNKLYELEKKALNSEIQALKNQINPHFLFNILNNVNVLITKDPQKASLVIVKFSDFLRYNLYESAEDFVYLSAEINHLSDYLQIENIRRDHFRFEILRDNEGYLGVKVPSNLLLTFVENAVKHSADPTGSTYIVIGFKTVGSYLHFTCQNSKPTWKKPAQEHGIGLVNVTRRLQLQYNGDYSLTIEDTDSQYCVSLTLPI